MADARYRLTAMLRFELFGRLLHSLAFVRGIDLVKPRLFGCDLVDGSNASAVTILKAYAPTSIFLGRKLR
jgi:hypothetical protein